MLRLMLCALAALSLATAACSDDDDGDATPTPPAEPTRNLTPVETPPPVQTPALDIREVDLEALPEVQAVLNPVAEEGFPEPTPGVFSQDDVVYADVTNDGHDDAIVPIFTEGMQSGMGFFLVTLNGETPVVLLQEFPNDTAGLAVTVEGEKIIMTQAVPGTDDPECCPSQLRITTYAWNGNAMAVESVATEPNPALAGTPTPQA